MLDEKIAAMKKEYRRRKQEDLELYRAESNQSQLTLEQLRNRMKRGKVLLPFIILDFSFLKFCEDQLTIPYAESFFDSQYEDAESFAFINQKYQCSLTGKKNPNKNVQIEAWKDEVFNTLIKHFIFPEFIAEYQTDDREYVTYLTRMTDGVFYNIVYRVFSDGHIWSGSARCINEKRQTLGLLLEAIVREIAG